MDVEFFLNDIQAALFYSWWRDDLVYGGCWFNCSWPSMRPGRLVCQFKTEPVLTHVFNGAYRYSATVQVRGVSEPVTTLVAYYVNNALLLNFNGTHGSPTFTDSSPNAAVPTVFGGAVLTTDPTKRTFGTAAGDFSVSTSTYIRFDASAALRMAGEFTVRFTWIPLASGLTSRFIMGSIGGGVDWHLWFTVNGSGFFECYACGFQTASTIAPVAGTKYYLMVRRNSAGQVAWFIDGAAQPAMGVSTQDDGSDRFWEIGGFPTGAGGGTGYRGYMDDLQIIPYAIPDASVPTAEAAQPFVYYA